MLAAIRVKSPFSQRALFGFIGFPPHLFRAQANTGALVELYPTGDTAVRIRRYMELISVMRYRADTD